MLCKGYFISRNLLRFQVKASVLDREACSAACLQGLESGGKGMRERKESLRWSRGWGRTQKPPYPRICRRCYCYHHRVIAQVSFFQRLPTQGHLPFAFAETFFYIKPEAQWVQIGAACCVSEARTQLCGCQRRGIRREGPDSYCSVSATV